MKTLIVVLIGLAILTLVACDVSNAETALFGPDEVEHDELAWFTVETEGVTPLLAIVTYQPYLDIDGDESPDWNERLTEHPIAAAADRFGVASADFFFVADTFYEAHDADVPSETVIMIDTAVYWSDPTTTRGLGRFAWDLEITGAE